MSQQDLLNKIGRLEEELGRSRDENRRLWEHNEVLFSSIKHIDEQQNVTYGRLQQDKKSKECLVVAFRSNRN